MSGSSAFAQGKEKQQNTFWEETSGKKGVDICSAHIGRAEDQDRAVLSIVV